MKKSIQTRKSSSNLVSLRRRLVLSAALVLSARAANEDLRICDYEKDMSVEFTECDIFNTSRNGKYSGYCQHTYTDNVLGYSSLIRVSLMVSLAYFYFVSHMPMYEGAQNVMHFCRVDESVNPTPKPIFGLPCQDTCEDGEYATVDYEKHKSEIWCDLCPKNTYSIGGGGILIDGTMGAFDYHGDDGNAMPLRMEPSCQVHSNDGSKIHRNDKCTPWSRTGTSLKAYQADLNEVMVDFDLSYPVFFDEPGTVEFKYRKDSIGNDKATYGIFKFLIDDYVQYDDDRLDVKDWQEFMLDKIPPGYHNLVWRYSKINILPFTEFLEAEIEVSSGTYFDLFDHGFCLMIMLRGQLVADNRTFNSLFALKKHSKP